MATVGCPSSQYLQSVSSPHNDGGEASARGISIERKRRKFRLALASYAGGVHDDEYYLIDWIWVQAEAPQPVMTGGTTERHSQPHVVSEEISNL